MNVLLDPQIFHSQKFGGISRLFVEVWKHSVQDKTVTINCPVVYTENYHLNESGLEPKNIFTVLHGMNFRGIGRIKDQLKSLSIKRTTRKLKQQEFDVFLSTYYHSYFIDPLGKKPFVLTVYDMIHEMFPQYFEADKTTIPQKKMLIERADKIIAISGQTKKDILKFYPTISGDKIEVIYLSQTIIDDGINVKGLPDNFILFVGNRGAYKNFKFFTEVAAQFLKSDPSLYMVCAGGGNLTIKENEMLQELGIYEKVVQMNYKDSELASIYKAAKVFVFPSAYEGFGIPTLEAMKCGCPVILSNSSCLPEVGGDAALYFENDGQDSLASVIEKVLSDEKLRKDLIEKGYKRTAEFSWEKTAQAYFKVIKSFAA